MIWQDWLISVGTWVILLALLPSIFSKDKPALKTSLLTGTVLAFFAFAYATLNLWTSTISTALISIAWFVLAVQKAIINKKG